MSQVALDAGRWDRLFEARDAGAVRVLELDPGPRDRAIAVRRFLRVALYCEGQGAEVLERKAREAPEETLAHCIAHHAREERSHEAMLRQLLEGEDAWSPRGPVGWAAGVLSHDRPFAEQMLATLIVESLGVAVYSMVADYLERGRASVVLRSIADDERMHLDFTRALLSAVMRGAPPAQIRKLRRIRSRLVGAIVVAHTLGHRAFLKGVSGLRVRDARSRILSEIESSLSGLAELSVLPQAQAR